MLKICLALFATVLAAYPSHSQSPIDENVIAIVVGDGQFAAKATIDGATVRRAIIYGRANDIARALEHGGRIAFKDCECNLSAQFVGKCIVDSSRRESVPALLYSLPTGTIRISVVQPSEIVAVFNSVQKRRGFGPAKEVSLPGICGSSSGGCDPGGDIDFNANGEISFTLGCENGAKMEIVSNGEVNLKFSAGRATMTLPVRAASRR